MARIHGNKILKRRSNVQEQSNYHNYLTDLSTDFQNTCGYCGKTTNITKNAFEIDHFVPKSIDKGRINDYNNLVYSCYQCNRKKHNKWPTNDPNRPNNGVEGFIDPTLDEFDLHIERNENGDIIGISDVGKYMVKAFAFDKRPMRELWQLIKLTEEKERLLSCSAKDPEAFECWQEVANQIDQLLNFMFLKKE